MQPLRFPEEVARLCPVEQRPLGMIPCSVNDRPEWARYTVALQTPDRTRGPHPFLVFPSCPPTYVYRFPSFPLPLTCSFVTTTKIEREGGYWAFNLYKIAEDDDVVSDPVRRLCFDTRITNGKKNVRRHRSGQKDCT